MINIRPPKQQTSYSEKDAEEIIKLYNEGATMREISEMTGRSYNSINAFITRMRKKQAKANEPNPVSEQSNRNYSAEDIKTIIKLYKEGKTYKQIGDIMGRSEAGIRGIIYRHLLSAPDDGPTTELKVGDKVVAKVPAENVEQPKSTSPLKIQEIEKAAPVVKVMPKPIPRDDNNPLFVPATAKAREMTPREMIKALYDMGYRIENNQPVCHVKQVVKINDIING